MNKLRTSLNLSSLICKNKTKNYLKGNYEGLIWPYMSFSKLLKDTNHFKCSNTVFPWEIQNACLDIKDSTKPPLNKPV